MVCLINPPPPGSPSVLFSNHDREGQKEGKIKES